MVQVHVRLLLRSLIFSLIITLEYYMNRKTLSLTLGAIATSVALSPTVNANENPFAMKTLSSATVFAAADEKMKDGKCGEGKCSAKKAPDAAAAAKTKEGNCGANKMKEGGCSGSAKTQSTTTPPRQ
jgi:uncharacterized low-complexity protein